MKFAQFRAKLDFDVGSVVEYRSSGMHRPLEVAGVYGIEISVGESPRKCLGLPNTLVRQGSIELALRSAPYVSLSFAMTNHDDGAPVRVWVGPENV